MKTLVTIFIACFTLAIGSLNASPDINTSTSTVECIDVSFIPVASFDANLTEAPSFVINSNHSSISTNYPQLESSFNTIGYSYFLMKPGECLLNCKNKSDESTNLRSYKSKSFSDSRQSNDLTNSSIYKPILFNYNC